MEFMRSVPDKAYDVCITDPPYGIGLEYGGYDDSKQNTAMFIKQFMPELLRVCNRVIITCGVSMMYEYPKPDWVGCWFSPAGAGRGPHGFCCWQPILIYGKDPWGGKGSRPDSFQWQGPIDQDASFHPCPKPLPLWNRIFKRWTIPSDKTCFDPFLGSATSAICAFNRGLGLDGCELDKDYFEAGQKRLDDHIAKYAPASDRPVNNLGQMKLL